MTSDLSVAPAEIEDVLGRHPAVLEAYMGSEATELQGAH